MPYGQYMMTPGAEGSGGQMSQHGGHQMAMAFGGAQPTWGPSSGAAQQSQYISADADRQNWQVPQASAEAKGAARAKPLSSAAASAMAREEEKRRRTLFGKRRAAARESDRRRRKQQYVEFLEARLKQLNMDKTWLQKFDWASYDVPPAGVSPAQHALDLRRIVGSSHGDRYVAPLGKGGGGKGGAAEAKADGARAKSRSKAGSDASAGPDDANDGLMRLASVKPTVEELEKRMATLLEEQASHEQAVNDALLDNGCLLAVATLLPDPAVAAAAAAATAAAVAAIAAADAASAAAAAVSSASGVFVPFNISGVQRTHLGPEHLQTRSALLHNLAYELRLTEQQRDALTRCKKRAVAAASRQVRRRHVAVEKNMRTHRVRTPRTRSTMLRLRHA